MLRQQSCTYSIYVYPSVFYIHQQSRLKPQFELILIITVIITLVMIEHDQMIKDKSCLFMLNEIKSIPPFWYHHFNKLKLIVFKGLVRHFGLYILILAQSSMSGLIALLKHWLCAKLIKSAPMKLRN